MEQSIHPPAETEARNDEPRADVAISAERKQEGKEGEPRPPPRELFRTAKEEQLYRTFLTSRLRIGLAWEERLVRALEGSGIARDEKLHRRIIDFTASSTDVLGETDRLLAITKGEARFPATAERLPDTTENEGEDEHTARKQLPALLSEIRGYALEMLQSRNALAMECGGCVGFAYQQIKTKIECEGKYASLDLKELYPDLRQTGFDTVTRKIEDFDPARAGGSSFGTFAIFYIRCAMLKVLETEAIQRGGQTASLDAPIASRDTVTRQTTLHDLVEDQTSPVRAQNAAARLFVGKLLARLPHQERRAVEMWFLEDKKYDAFREEMGMSPSAAKAAVRAGLRKLKEMSGAARSLAPEPGDDALCDPRGACDESP